MAIALCTTTACDTRDGEANLEDERTNFLVWSFLLNPALTDFATACNTAVTNGQSCATAAGDVSLYATGYLNSNFAAVSDTSSPATACTTYPEAGVLLNYTQAAKVCWFNCETSYWTTGMSGGNCTGANFATYAASAFATITTCSNTCRANGTLFIY
ncbi:MAG: hypothetical protein NXI24_20640 [bacterium]|nr:hypothetical protein [bacterium]